MNVDHYPECESFRSLDNYYPCICPQLEFRAGRAVVLMLDGLYDKVMAARDKVVVTHSEERPTASEGALGAYDRVLSLLMGDVK